MIVIRRVRPKDSSDLFAWRNDPQTREASIRQAPISWDEHREWFGQSLANPSRLIFVADIGEGDGPAEPAGVCRFDTLGPSGTAEVSVNLNPSFRGRGLATPILKSAIDEYFRERGGPTDLLARIRPSNVASVRAFGAAGFLFEGADDEQGFDRYRRPAGDA
jgi:RimJ/RimL family protein N-acetyltransferase